MNKKQHLMVRASHIPFDTIDRTYKLPNIAYLMGGDDAGEREIKRYALLDDSGFLVSIESVAIDNDTAQLGLIEHVITEAIDEHFADTMGDLLDKAGL